MRKTVCGGRHRGGAEFNRRFLPVIPRADCVLNIENKILACFSPSSMRSLNYSAIFKVSGILALICMSLGAKLSEY